MTPHRLGHPRVRPACGCLPVRCRHAQAAQVLVWLALLMPLLVGVAGLAIDGATVFAARRELQSVADGAARAGATQVDLGSLRADDGAALQLVQGTGPHTAAGVATAYLQARARTDVHWPDGLQWRVGVTGPQVSILVQADVPTAFLRIVHISSVPIDAASSADLRHGIAAPVE
jgi:Flp pilus assembly protein TadG